MRTFARVSRRDLLRGALESASLLLDGPRRLEAPPPLVLRTYGFESSSFEPEGDLSVPAVIAGLLP